MKNLSRWLLLAALVAFAPHQGLAQTIPGGGGGGTSAPCSAFGTTAGTCLQGAGALGTPSSGTGTNLTGIPLTSGVTGTLPVANGGTGVTSAQGNGSKVQLSTGAATLNDCVKFDANGNTVSSGAGCGTGSGSVTSVATGACLTGGPITTTGTVAGTYAIRAVTGTTDTILAGDACGLVTYSNGSAVASTLPAPSGSFASGFGFDVQNLGAGTVTITPGGGALINGAATLTVAQNRGCSVASDGTNYQLSACTALVTGTSAAGSSGDVQKNNGSGAFAASALNDNGTAISSTEAINIKTNTIYWEIANAGSTGTSANKIAKFTGAPSTAVIATTADTTGIIGVVAAGAGTTGSAQIAVSGQVNCVFDGATTSGDFVIVSVTVNGDCHDSGASDPTGVAVLGNVLSTNGSAGTYAVMLYPPNVSSLGTTGNPGGGNGGIKITGSPASGNLTAWSGTKTITNTNLTGVVTTSGSSATSLQSSVALPGSPTTTTQTAGDSSTKVATTAFVAAAVTASNPAVAVQAATTQASDTSSLTYNNGVSGIGATFTGANNTALTIDGYTFTAVGQRLLVKNDTQSPSGAFNGVYYLTQLQALGLPPILTRALDYDMPSDMNNTGAIPVANGTVNAQTSWFLTSQVTTVGTDPLTFTQLTVNPTNVAQINQNQTWTKSQRGTPVALTISTATFTPNFDTAQNFEITLIHASCPCTLANPSTTLVPGQSGYIKVIQSATGSDSITTWGSSYYFPGGTSTITFSTGASQYDLFSYVVDLASHINLTPPAQNFSH